MPRLALESHRFHLVDGLHTNRTLVATAKVDCHTGIDGAAGRLVAKVDPSRDTDSSCTTLHEIPREAGLAVRDTTVLRIVQITDVALAA
jgi:hypothetical protein